MTAQSTGLAERILDWLAKLSMGVASVLMVILIAIFGWLVFGRYVLNNTPTWVEQAALLIVVWIAFLGAAVGVRRGTHLSVEFFRDALPPRLRAGMVTFASLALLFFGVVMAWQGYVMFDRTVRRDIPLLGISEGWRAVPVSLSGVLIVLFCLDDLIRPVLLRQKD
ncbi:TRAP transporter small permease [Actibacterium sp. 188UL27-1]|uniref:TRAP transporter small permease n=1 Tax=Actibacterium sp. 188UL27-1 TaxID=2786961 RepID=UPI00195A60EA|nr:TRAP transporter small permease [Actibacterium sp. 188UL27-1]MBM7069798.1 TRAP transporter small permease [Actibacterium sp. 188UL27-1]